jgi:hypothetical protein
MPNGQPGTPYLPLFSQILLNILNIQNFVASFYAKVCKKDAAWGGHLKLQGILLSSRESVGNPSSSD